MRITGLRDVDFSARETVLSLRRGETVEVKDDGLAELAIRNGMAEPAAKATTATPPAADKDSGPAPTPAREAAPKSATKKATKKRSKK